MLYVSVLLIIDTVSFYIDLKLRRGFWSTDNDCWLIALYCLKVQTSLNASFFFLVAPAGGNEAGIPFAGNHFKI